LYFVQGSHCSGERSFSKTGTPDVLKEWIEMEMEDMASLAEETKLKTIFPIFFFSSFGQSRARKEKMIRFRE
jgi:hypothetical protein